MGNLGWPEILIILVIALIIFGPRKLPELGKSLGQSLAQFRRASEDFKRTWEDEVESEKHRLDAPPPVAEHSYDSETGVPDESATADQETAAEGQVAVTTTEAEPVASETPATVHRSESTHPETKRDWM